MALPWMKLARETTNRPRSTLKKLERSTAQMGDAVHKNKAGKKNGKKKKKKAIKESVVGWFSLPAIYTRHIKHQDLTV